MSEPINKEDLIKMPDSDENACFGCSGKNTSGLQMDFYTTSGADRVYSWLNLPSQFCGWSNLAHGGIISTVLDEIMAWGSMAVLGKFILSKSITVDFLKPVILGTDIRAEGWVETVKSERESILAGCIYNSDEEICARSTCVAATLTLDAARKMGVSDEKMLAELDYMMNSWR